MHQLTDEEREAVAEVLCEFLDNEPEILRRAHNYDLSEEEVRARAERHNLVVDVVDLYYLSDKKVIRFTDEVIDEMAGCCK